MPNGILGVGIIALLLVVIIVLLLRKDKPAPMATHAVTQDLWKTMRGNNPSNYPD